MFQRHRGGLWCTVMYDLNCIRFVIVNRHIVNSLNILQTLTWSQEGHRELN